MNSLLCLLFPLLAQASNYPMHVIVDAGHGGKDDGALRGKYREATITLAVAKQLKTFLSKDNRFRVTLTRKKDVLLPLGRRTDIAKSRGGDVLVSIHANASSDPRAQGVEFYIKNELPPDEDVMFLANREDQGDVNDASPAPLRKDPSRGYRSDVKFIIQDLQRSYHSKASAELARTIAESWSSTKRRRRHSIRQAPFFVVSKSRMPSALVELGFVTNKKEAIQLSDPKEQKQLAYNIYKGLIKFQELLDK